MEGEILEKGVHKTEPECQWRAMEGKNPREGSQETLGAADTLSRHKFLILFVLCILSVHKLNREHIENLIEIINGPMLIHPNCTYASNGVFC